MEDTNSFDGEALINTCNFYCKTAKFEENRSGSDPFLKLSLLRRVTSQLGNLSYIISDNKVTYDILNSNLKTYSELLDNKKGVNNYAEGVQALLKYSKNGDCQKWKSGLSIVEGDQVIEKYIPEICQLQDCQSTSSSSFMAKEDIQLLVKTFLNKSGLLSNDSSMTPNVAQGSQVYKPNFSSDNYNAFNHKRKHDSQAAEHFETLKNKKVEPPNSWVASSGTINTSNRFKPNLDGGEAKPDFNKPKTSSSMLKFRTASSELRAQNMKKYGKDRMSDANDNGQQQKRSLGTRPRSTSSKFVNPLKSNNDDGHKSDPEQLSQEDVDPRLQHIDSKMIEMIRSEIMDCTNPITWDDIAGLHFAKSTIQEIVVWPMLRPDIFTGLRRPPKGILLFGPPGTGKTLIAKCIASQSRSTFFSISASSLTSKWIGDGEKMVRALFTVARVDQPSVVFIDEIDSLLSKRSDTEHESSRRIKTEFLVQLDGATTGEEDRLLIIGATNRPYELDEAARRRLVKRLYIPLPDHEARVEMVTRLMAKERNNLTAENIKWVGDLTDGYSGADVKILCQEAALGPIRSISYSQIEHITSDQVRPVTLEDFKNALNRVRSSVSPDDLKCYIEWDKTYGSGGQ